jgi:hypothetical protein
MRGTRNGQARLGAKDPLATLLPAFLDGRLSVEGVAMLGERLKRDARLRRDARVLLQESMLREVKRDEQH